MLPGTVGGVAGPATPETVLVPAPETRLDPSLEPLATEEGTPPSAVAIVVGAGAGVRMGADLPKALMPLAGRPLVAWSVDALAASARVGAIVVVAPPDHVEEMTSALAGHVGVEVVPGGATRAESVGNGLDAAPGEPEQVLVHDAARPLLRPELVDAVLAALDGADGALAAAPVSDTVKRVGADLLVAGTVDRRELWAAQTPQAFWTERLRAAVAAAIAAGTLATATDCASLVELAGGTVRVVGSLAPNLKVTTPADMAVAEALLGLPPAP